MRKSITESVVGIFLIGPSRNEQLVTYERYSRVGQPATVPLGVMQSEVYNL